MVGVFKQVFGMGFFSRRVTSAVSFCFSIHVSAFCDASDYAFGGYRIKLNDQPVSGMFSQFESQQSSTFRELKAIFYVIEAHVVSLRHKKVKDFTDNENASRIVSVGSPKQHLQCLALDIFQLCLVNDIQIDAQWIPRNANVGANLLSRFVDKDDWSLNCEIFALDFACIVQHFPAVNQMARVWHAFATVTGRHSCVCCCTLASFERGLSCIPRFGT